MNVLRWSLTLVIGLLVYVCAVNGQRGRAKSEKSIGNPTTKIIICDNRTRITLDNHLHKLLSSKFPTNNRELRQFCNQGYRSTDYVQTYIKQCLPDFSQKVVSIVFFPIRKELAAICKSGRLSSKAKELIKASKCGNAARPGLRKCYYKFIGSELAIAQAETKMQMPLLCCQFHSLRDCFKTEAEEIKECTARTIDYVERWAIEIFGEIIDLMCYEYPAASDRCDKVLPELPKINLNGVTLPKSFLSPLMVIFANYGAEDANSYQ